MRICASGDAHAPHIISAALNAIRVMHHASRTSAHVRRRSLQFSKRFNLSPLLTKFPVGGIGSVS
jgi:hypothetical protein